MSQNSPFQNLPSQDSSFIENFGIKIIQGFVADMHSAKIGIVTAKWNSQITFELEKGALEFMYERKLRPSHVVRVPGAYECPLAAKHLLDLGLDGVIVLGCVIRGETTHYEAICNSVERGCTDLQVSYGRPVTFGVLTTENVDQALDRVGGRHGHKGREAAEVCLEMIQLNQKLGVR